ncbi:MAG TPA: 1-deoxy-D-xylulose-5-phosphate synthase N-terminal domain-containing protein [Candidatus Tectomicrobia bacterium]
MSAEALDILHHIARRVLWLTTYLLHYINKLRPGPDNLKVGGHQASSASLVSLLTALYCAVLRPADQVAIKPHAAPVFHVIQYLLGKLSQAQLRTLRDLDGLQAYPNRTKDPDGITISTASAGLGAAATIFGALTQRYVRDHFGKAGPGRYIALVGDAELDEGNIPEALGEASAYGLDNLWWIIDFNRQSLDRILPDRLAGQIRRQFEAKDWQVLELRYGTRQEAFFQRPGGMLLKEWLDTCSNSAYQSLMTCSGAELRRVLLHWGATRGSDMAALLTDLDDAQLQELVFNTGGHDLRQILRTLADAAQMQGPLMILAYTTKGWGLPIAGHLENHAALLTDGQLAALQAAHDIAPGSEWDGFAPGSLEYEWMQHMLEQRGFRTGASQTAVADVRPPDSLRQRYPAVTSTQAAFGQMLTALHDVPQLGDRLVTISPDVAVSTNLGAWINRRGIYAPVERPNYWQAHGVETLLQWNEGPRGQHIELGIAEHNFYLALAMLGLSFEMQGEMLWPIGTIYDPFVERGLDALKYGTYAHSKFLFVGTPSGLTLCREAGAHQSFLTPLLGMGIPNLVFYEPAYAAELEVMLCWALRQLTDRQHGESVYLRLSTRALPQEVPDHTTVWRQQVLAGGYWLRDYRQQADYHARPRVHLFASGVMLAEALTASAAALEEGIYANVINVTSADRLFRGWMARCRGERVPIYLDTLLPHTDRQVPAVTLLDGHPLTLAWLGNMLHAPLRALGVTAFGESAALPALYHKHQIDADAIVGAIAHLLYT